MNIGTAEQEQKGVTIPRRAAITFPAASRFPARIRRARSGVKTDGRRFFRLPDSLHRLRTATRLAFHRIYSVPVIRDLLSYSVELIISTYCYLSI